MGTNFSGFVVCGVKDVLLTGQRCVWNFEVGYLNRQAWKERSCKSAQQREGKEWIRLPGYWETRCPQGGAATKMQMLLSQVWGNVCESLENLSLKILWKGSIIHYRQSSHNPIVHLMNGQNVVSPYSEILLNHKKEWCTSTHHKMDDLENSM